MTKFHIELSVSLCNELEEIGKLISLSSANQRDKEILAWLRKAADELKAFYQDKLGKSSEPLVKDFSRCVLHYAGRPDLLRPQFILKHVGRGSLSSISRWIREVQNEAFSPGTVSRTQPSQSVHAEAHRELIEPIVRAVLSSLAHEPNLIQRSTTVDPPLFPSHSDDSDPVTRIEQRLDSLSTHMALLQESIAHQTAAMNRTVLQFEKLLKIESQNARQAERDLNRAIAEFQVKIESIQKQAEKKEAEYIFRENALKAKIIEITPRDRKVDFGLAGDAIGKDSE